MSHITRFWTRSRVGQNDINKHNLSDLRTSIIAELSQTPSTGLTDVNLQAKIIEVKQQIISKCSELIQTAANALTEKINKVKDDIKGAPPDEIESRIAEVNKNIESYKVRIDQLEADTTVAQLSENIQSIQEKIQALEARPEKADTSTNDAIDDRIQTVEDRIAELETNHEITDAARQTSLTHLQDQLSGLVKVTKLSLASGFNGELYFLSFKQLHFLSGYVGFDSNVRNPIVCDLPDYTTFLPYHGIGIYIGKNGLNKPMYINNNQNR